MMGESYMQKLYRTDPIFREKQKKRAIQWALDNRDQKNETERRRYATRTPKQVKERKQYLINLRMKT